MLFRSPKNHLHVPEVHMKKYIHSLNLEIFRGISNLSVDNLSAINVVVGGNNSGKTSILEAIRVLAQPYEIGNILRVASSRAWKTKPKNYIDTVMSIFKKEQLEGTSPSLSVDSYSMKIGGNINNDVAILEIDTNISNKLNVFRDGEDKVNKGISGTLSFSLNSIKKLSLFTFDESSHIDVDSSISLFNCTFMSTNVNTYNSCVSLYSDVVKSESKETFITVLKIFDKDISDITIVDDMIWIHNAKKGIMPLFSYGSGLQKALLLSIVISLAKDGVLLIDEIETAVHTSALPKVFSFLVNACNRLKVQLFITTHSLEAIDKLLASASDMGFLEDMQVITLFRTEKSGNTFCKQYSGKTALEKRELYEMELRV